MPDGASIDPTVFGGHAALRLRAGPVDATFLPALGLLGASLRFEGEEHLALPVDLEGYRAGHVTGLPILAPWANRLDGFTYKAAGRTVELRQAAHLHLDPNGLPIHGTLTAQPWELVRAEAGRDAAMLRARFAFGDRPDLLVSFPFPHDLEVEAVVDPGGLTVATSLVPTGRRGVPVSFGWHPYFRLPGVKRRDLRVVLPSREHLVLDERMIPTGATVREPAEAEPLARRSFDDGYRLGRHRHLALEGDGRRLTVQLDRRYPYAQVYAPAGQDHVAVEPMTAPTNGLATGACPLVSPGERFTARFRIRFG